MVRKLVIHMMFVLALCVFAGALVVIGTMTAGAQPIGAPRNSPLPAPPGNGPQLPLLASIPGLNDQQSVALRNALEAERAAMRALDESTRPQRDAIHATTRAKLATILTAAQLARYQEWRAARRPPPPPRMMEGAAGQADPGPDSQRNRAN